MSNANLSIVTFILFILLLLPINISAEVNSIAFVHGFLKDCIGMMGKVECEIIDAHNKSHWLQYCGTADPMHCADRNMSLDAAQAIVDEQCTGRHVIILSEVDDYGDITFAFYLTCRQSEEAISNALCNEKFEAKIISIESWDNLIFIYFDNGSSAALVTDSYAYNIVNILPALAKAKESGQDVSVTLGQPLGLAPPNFESSILCSLKIGSNDFITEDKTTVLYEATKGLERCVIRNDD